MYKYEYIYPTGPSNRSELSVSLRVSKECECEEGGGASLVATLHLPFITKPSGESGMIF